MFSLLLRKLTGRRHPQLRALLQDSSHESLFGTDIPDKRRLEHPLQKTPSTDWLGEALNNTAHRGQCRFRSFEEAEVGSFSYRESKLSLDQDDVRLERAQGAMLWKASPECLPKLG